ncbi:MAG: hypothetical protein KC502_23985, partial [Myxococcales bacterium]|nr:hypothetical protein [Myxococcales bacterium]
HSNVVLRGHGADETRLWFTDANVVEAQAHLKVGGTLTHGEDLLLTADGARGDIVVRVGDASALQPGDDVDVGWQISDAFVAAHGMTGTWKAFNGSWRPFFRRTVVSVDTSQTPHRVTLDVPLRYPTLLRDKASLRKTDGWISEVGIEGIGVSDAVDWATAWSRNQVHAIEFQGVKDGWLRDVVSFEGPKQLDTGFMPHPHLQSGGIQIRDSKRVTLADCHLSRAQHRGGGGNGYLFEYRTSSEILTRDCTASHGRHNFIQNWGFGLSGCVWLRVHSSFGKALLGPGSDIGLLGFSEFHHSLAMANLIDDSEFGDGWASQNRQKYSTGAGQTATRNIMWRPHGSGLLLSYNYGDGFVIGPAKSLTIHSSLERAGSAAKGEGTAPEDFVEGHGDRAGLQPPSLYEAQLKLRVARAARD